MAKCVNETGEDISTVSFLIDYYKGDKKVATGYAESSMLVKDRVFVVSFEAPADGWYEVHGKSVVPCQFPRSMR